MRLFFGDFFELLGANNLAVQSGFLATSAVCDSHKSAVVSHWNVEFGAVGLVESRMCQIEILPSPSVLLRGMEGNSLPIVVAHGEGRIDPACDIKQLEETSCMRYVSRVSWEGDHTVADTWNYPQNPNGSKGGVTALTNADGRFTIMMPHPERVFRLIQNRLAPRMWGVPGQDSSPWIKLFENARRWLD